MNDLHSACTGPGIAPFSPGSTTPSSGSRAATGVGVSPTPQKHVVAFQNGDLTERIYQRPAAPTQSGPTSATPDSTRILLERGDRARAAATARFLLLRPQAGVIQTTPLPVPL